MTSHKHFHSATPELLNSCNSCLSMWRCGLDGALAIRSSWSLFATFKQFHDHREEDRGQENAKKRHSDHPAENGSTDGLAHFRAGSGAIDEWKYPQGKRKRSH